MVNSQAPSRSKGKYAEFYSDMKNMCKYLNSLSRPGQSADLAVSGL